MVLQQHLDAGPLNDQTLACLWHTQAKRVDGRTIAGCVGFGFLAAIIPVFIERATLIASFGLVVAFFGTYSAVVQPSFGGRWLRPRAQRLIGAAVSTLAAMAAIVAGLLFLGIVFGGSIEVMRR